MNGILDSIRSYSDIALKGAIRSLEAMRFRGEWGDERLAVLKAERARRAAEDKQSTK